MAPKTYNSHSLPPAFSSWLGPATSDPNLTQYDLTSDSLTIEFDSRQVAIAITTAPRSVPTLHRTIDSLRHGQFEQPVHVFAEPNTLVTDRLNPNVVVHQNPRRLGCYPNWLNAARWLLTETDCPYLLLCEDDGVFCRGSAAALYYGLERLPDIGCLSLYTPVHNYTAGQHTEAGWFALRGNDRWGSVAQCFPRSVLEEFVMTADSSQPDGTDRHVEAFLNRHQLHWYCHAPSLVDHIGHHSTLGHVSGLANVGIGFQAEFTGYRNTSSAAASLATQSTDMIPRVSIVLPIYNGERYLQESIESCLHQSFTDWELIIVDDGSTDNTDRILRSYDDRRLTFIRHAENRKLPEALNSGFRQSRGSLLTWTSCDNRFMPNALQSLVQFLDHHPETHLVYSNFNFIDQQGNILSHHRAGPTEMLTEGNVVGMCFLYRREVYEAVGEYRPEAFLAEDYDYWLRTAQLFRLTHLPRTLYEHRLHPDSLTSRYSQVIPTVAHTVRQWNSDRNAVPHGHLS